MDLQEQLARQIDRFEQEAPPGRSELYRRMRDELRKSFRLEDALSLGDTAPDFTLPEARGRSFTLSEVLRDGPVVLTFYRGGWCPYCNIQLRAYQAALPEIRQLKATLAAISPQTPDASLSTAEKDALEFDVLSDHGNEVGRAFGLVYKLAPELREVMKGNGKPLSQFNGDDSWDLPVPATYVVAPNGRIALAYVETDHRQRLASEDILIALRQLNA